MIYFNHKTKKMLKECYSGHGFENDLFEEEKTVVYNGKQSCTIFTDHHSLVRHAERSLKSDLDKLSLPNEIKNKADDIYRSMTIGTKRSKKRKMLVFFCVLKAYEKMNIPQEPIHLANVCGLERSDISRAISMCAPYLNDGVSKEYKPREFILVHFKRIQDMLDFPEESLDEIYDLNDKIMTKDDSLRDEKPQTVAAAILVLYLKLQGFVIDKNKYKSIFGSSDMTINKIYKRVYRAYNF